MPELPVAPREAHVTIDGLRFAYREWSGGNATPPILLIHGLASSRRIWDLVAPLLARDRQVVALDQRGHGESDKPPDGYTIAQAVADDRALAAALELECPVVAGHSWGGAVALAWAAAHPGSLAGLVLIDGGIGEMQSRPGASWERIERDLMPPDYAGTPREAFLERLRRRGDLPWRPEFEAIMLGIVDLRPDDTIGPRLAREHHRQILRSLWEFRPRDHFERVTCPVTIVLAESAAVDPQARERLAARQRDADAAWHALRPAPSRRLVWFSQTVHDIPLHRPEALAAEIMAVTGTLTRP